MFASIAIVVFSCAASASFDDFNPHRLDAAKLYVIEHPEICQADPPLVLDAEVSLEQCRSRAMLNFMPGWMKQIIPSGSGSAPDARSTSLRT